MKDYFRNNKWGFLRETKADAEKAKNAAAKKKHDSTKLLYTGLEEYLAVIFPEINEEEWIHNKSVSGTKRPTKPDYRCDKLKLIIEFDGLHHYTNPYNVMDDSKKDKAYTDAGYKVVRIPYFIQLTNEVIEQLFERKVSQPMFNPSIPSMSIEWKNTPAYCCHAGVVRMGKDFMRFPQQYEVNMESLREENDEFFSGVSLLEAEYRKLRR